MAFNNWPFTNFQDLNLDWVLRKLREAVAQATQAASTVAGYAARLLTIENSDSQQNRKISNLETSDALQNQKITTLENSDSAQNARLNAAESNISALTTQVGRNTSGLLDAIKVVSQEFSSDEKVIARSNIGAGNTTVSYYPNTNTLVIRDEVTGETETIDLTSSTSGYDNIRKLLYNETTGNVVYYNGTTTTPYTGGEVIANFMSNGKILTFMEGALDRGQGNILYNDYMPLTYDATNGVFFYRIYNNNVEIIRLPLNSSTGIKTITPIGGSSDESVFLITAVYSNGKYTFDKNQADILSAIQSGRLPVVRYHTTTSGNASYHIYYEWVFDYYSYDGEDAYIYFSRVDQNGNSAQLRWTGSEGKAVEVSRPTLPPATGADEGKIPMVNSFGNYQLVTPSSTQGTPKISMASTDDTPSLDANKFYVFPEMASLSVTLNTPASNAIVNEFHFRFTSGSTATQFDLPASVIIPDDFDVAADTVYEISIVDNYMVYSSWAVTA